MEPAASIIKRLGGNTVVARACERLPVTVYRWKLPRSRGGTGGRIPVSCRAHLLRLANSRGVSIAPEDLLSPDELAQPAAGET